MTVSFDLGGALKFLLIVAALAAALLIVRNLIRWFRKLFAPKFDGLDRGLMRQPSAHPDTARVDLAAAEP